ncbi:DUF2520 domain-containing protein [Croceitalea sp. MTPC5]|uniref:Rossmann-like and DUF2520 domain-containing protein n=1 Tax=Croceitalea sp. MTPC5 TaxID=3056565 RepID=UPI002B3D9D35|nr:DUF2520 domain-containing protein [Croceitalea sp. MTPC5]
MISIVILGSGNVAFHLYTTLLEIDDINVIQVFGRNNKTLERFNESIEITTHPEHIKSADLYLIAVNDDAIPDVAELLDKKTGLVCHTSGGVQMDVIKAKRKGVFYPLQSFTMNREIDFNTIPICIEATEESDLALLRTMGLKISRSVHEISSAQRQYLHLAAVFANNFSNHLFYIASELCKEQKLSFELLKPLLHESIAKLGHANPKKAQTGPARRGDNLTMQKHLDQLKSPIQKKIYQLLSESIKTTYEEKL